jgi:hypothetical protein
MNLNKANSAFSIAMAWLVSTICISCANSPYINVDYRLPIETQPMITEDPVYINAADLRSDTAILNDSAKKKFANFSGQFALLIRESDNQQSPLGHHDLQQLFETAFAHRLNQLAVPIAEQPPSETLRFQIDINRFHIGLAGNKWSAEIGYKASLIENKKRVSSETVTGSAERPKLVGRGGAEKVIGEIFTDVINQLDIERLFRERN